MFEGLGSAATLGCIRADVRDPLEVWFGLLLARVIAVCPGNVGAAAFFAQKLSQALEEQWSAESIRDFLNARGLAAVTNAC